MTTIAVYPSPHDIPRDQGVCLLGGGNSTAPAPVDMPTSISHDQLYFWTTKWQDDEMTADAELAAGEGHVFGSPRDAISWLLDVSDDDE